MYLLRAGMREVPLDRLNSILELRAAGLEDLSDFGKRIQRRHYDRIYLTVEDWLSTQQLEDVNRYYREVQVVPEPACSGHIATGRFLALIGDCRILVPREVPLSTDAGDDAATDATTD
jgi:hypothetical protein